MKLLNSIALGAPLLVSATMVGCTTEQPNILVIITDQQRYDALGSAGVYPFLNTPNIDRLASEGASFTRAYTPCAVSGPARASLLTGLFVENTGVLTNEITAQDPVAHNVTTQPTIDKVLAEAGYYTEYHGKWHCPIGWTECYEGFEYLHKGKNPFAYQTKHFLDYRDLINKNFPHLKPREGELLSGGPMSGVPYSPDPIDRRVLRGVDAEGNLEESASQSRKMTQPDLHGELILPDEFSLTAFQSKEAIAGLERAAKQDKPFAITLSLNFPHAPMLPTEGYYQMYNVDDMPTPTSILDPMVDSPYSTQNGKAQLPEYSDAELIKYMMSNYFGLVTEIDDWVGEILSTLDRLGLSDNTIIVFVSDHGEMLGSHGLREKNIFLEESSRVPFIIHYPKAIKPTIIDEPTTTLDIFSTLLDYVGVDEVGERNSRSLRGLIEGNESDTERVVVTEWLYNDIRQPSHQIVKGGWKLFFNYSAASKIRPVLFNLKNDPYEMCNLLGDSNPNREEYLAKANELKTAMEQWLEDRGSIEMVQQIKTVTLF